jgi:hypothetical protein
VCPPKPRIVLEFMIVIILIIDLMFLFRGAPKQSPYSLAAMLGSVLGVTSPQLKQRCMQIQRRDMILYENWKAFSPEWGV